MTGSGFGEKLEPAGSQDIMKAAKIKRKFFNKKKTRKRRKKKTKGKKKRNEEARG